MEYSSLQNRLSLRSKIFPCPVVICLSEISVVCSGSFVDLVLAQVLNA